MSAIRRLIEIYRDGTDTWGTAGSIRRAVCKEADWLEGQARQTDNVDRAEAFREVAEYLRSAAADPESGA